MYKIDSIVLAKSIDKFCKAYNIPKKEFHSSSGISSATLTQWRQGKEVASLSVQRVETYFKMPVDELMEKYSGETRSIQFSNSKMRILFDAAKDATDADLLEAAALLERRKEERRRSI